MMRRPVIYLLGGLLTATLSQTGTAAQAGGQKAGPAPGETLSESYRGSQRDNVEYQ